MHRAHDHSAQPVPFDAKSVRNDFPILTAQPGEQPLAYLDSAATAQKPRQVIDAVQRYYSAENANIHRGVYALSEAATQAYEAGRSRVARFINAHEAAEIVFVRGATEAINLIAESWGGTHLKQGDEILLSAMEHHANIVPWQQIAKRTGAIIRVIPISDEGELDMEAFEEMVNERTRLLTIVHASNALGTINPVRQMAARVKQVGATVLVDAAQSIVHFPLDVQELDCDFLVFSGHKLFAPTGIGVLYGKAEVLRSMPPYQSGGDMIETVTFSGSTFRDIPARFEAGTPHIAGVVGLDAAIRYLQGLDIKGAQAHEADLLAYATRSILAVPGIRLWGNVANKTGVLSFTMEQAHPHDIGTILDAAGIAIRSGHHCAQPLMDRYGLTGTARASLTLYNNREDVDRLIAGLHKVHQLFG